MPAAAAARGVPQPQKPRVPTLNEWMKGYKDAKPAAYNERIKMYEKLYGPKPTAPAPAAPPRRPSPFGPTKPVAPAPAPARRPAPPPAAVKSAPAPKPQPLGKFTGPVVPYGR